jgi:hypothetical protein
MKFREHRGGLAESMETVVEVANRVELIIHLAHLMERYPGTVVDFQKIKIEPYGGWDERIGWDTYIVTLEGYGVLGFTNGPL